MQIASVIDNPWSVVLARSSKVPASSLAAFPFSHNTSFEQAALVLADAIEQRIHGQRPLTIVAYSMGAKLVFNALEELARREDERERVANSGSAVDTKESPTVLGADDKPAILRSFDELQKMVGSTWCSLLASFARHLAQGLSDNAAKAALIQADGDLARATELLVSSGQASSSSAAATPSDWSEFLQKRGLEKAVKEWRRKHKSAALVGPSAALASSSSGAAVDKKKAATSEHQIPGSRDTRGVLFDVFLFGAFALNSSVYTHAVYDM